VLQRLHATSRHYFSPKGLLTRIQGGIVVICVKISFSNGLVETYRYKFKKFTLLPPSVFK